MIRDPAKRVLYFNNVAVTKPLVRDLVVAEVTSHTEK